MTTSRGLASRLGDEVQVRGAHPLLPPVHGFVLTARPQDSLSESGPVVVFTLTVTEQTPERQIGAVLETGTPEEWAPLPSLPPPRLRRETTLEA